MKPAVDRYFGVTTLNTHPFLEGAEFDAVGMTILLEFIEPTQKA